MYNRKNSKVLYAEIQLEPWFKFISFGYYASLFPSQNKKVKTVFVNSYSNLTIQTSFIGIASLRLAIQIL